MKIRWFVMAFIVVWFANQGRVLAQQDVPPEIFAYPDIVLYNGKIVTADDNFSVAEAVAVRDGKFLAIGPTDQIQRMVGPNTRKIDLMGKSVIPGLIGTHMHGWAGNVATSSSRSAGRVANGYDLPSIIFTTKDVGLQKIKAAIENGNFPPGKWIWASSIRTTASLNMTARELDTVSPNNPLSLTISPQEAMVNSKALEELLDKSPVIQMGGGLMKGRDGKPNGQIRGNAFGTLFYEFFPWTDLGTLIEEQKRQFQRNLRDGITTRIGRAQGFAVTVLNELHTRGEIPLRVRISHEFLRMLPDAERFFKRMGNLTGLGDDMFKIIGTVEQQVDGGSRQGAIYTKQPKLRMMEGAAYGLYGANYWGEEQGYNAGNSPRENIILAGKYGWPVVSLHSYGDQVIQLSLDAYEQGIKQWPPALTKHRWVLDHNWTHDDQTIAKTKELDVQLSVSAWWRMTEEEMVGIEGVDSQENAFGMTDEPLIYMYGVDRLASWSPAQRLIKAGLKPFLETGGRGFSPSGVRGAAGVVQDPSSDLAGVEVFITRKDARGRVWGPNERVDRKTALWMKTRWAARYTHEEDNIGSIERGKFADFLILGGDYMTVPEEQIHSLPILMTVVGGKVRFEEPGKL